MRQHYEQQFYATQSLRRRLGILIGMLRRLAWYPRVNFSYHIDWEIKSDGPRSQDLLPVKAALPTATKQFSLAAATSSLSFPNRRLEPKLPAVFHCPNPQPRTYLLAHPKPFCLTCLNRLAPCRPQS